MKISDDKRVVVCLGPMCGKELIQGRAWQKYCSDRCRNRHWSQLHPRAKVVKVVDEGSEGKGL